MFKLQTWLITWIYLQLDTIYRELFSSHQAHDVGAYTFFEMQMLDKIHYLVNEG